MDDAYDRSQYLSLEKKNNTPKTITKTGSPRQ